MSCDLALQHCELNNHDIGDTKCSSAISACCLWMTLDFAPPLLHGWRLYHCRRLLWWYAWSVCPLSGNLSLNFVDQWWKKTCLDCIAQEYTYNILHTLPKQRQIISLLCTNDQNCYYAMNHQELVQSVHAKMQKSICSLFVKLPIWHSLRGTLKVAIWILKEMWSNCVQNFFGTNSNLLARFCFVLFCFFFG
jgi:hypothetical protein